MKRSILNIACILTASTALLSSCGKDNYDAPSSQLKGIITYQGQPVGVRGSNESVYLQLWQDGFQTREPINVYVTQDGSFSAMLFDGDYKLITVPGNGPWEHSSDTLNIQVKGNTQVEYPVDLYYSLSDVQYELSGETLQVSFQTEQLASDRSLDDISLMIGDTRFVDLGHFIKRETAAEASEGRQTISMDIGPELANNPRLFARLAVKVNGVTEALYDANLFEVK